MIRNKIFYSAVSNDSKINNSKKTGTVYRQLYDPTHPDSTGKTNHRTVYYLCTVTIFRKILLTVLCIQVLLPKDLLENIVRLPVLVAHYFHHNHTDKHIHFTDFIADHYSDHEHHDKDHDNHNNLPLHNHNCNFQQNIFTLAVLDIFPTLLSNYDVASRKIKIFSRQHFYSSTALSSIWRPPKFA